MKVLVDGGLNLSSLDGWWAEAFSVERGWAFDAPGDHPERDAIEASQLYDLLEREIVPAFYTRDERGIPIEWVSRMRASMATLTARFSTSRMLREYVEALYLRAAARFRDRSCDEWRLARELAHWSAALTAAWHSLAVGTLGVRAEHGGLSFTLPVRLGALTPEMVRVELYADAIGDEPARHVEMLADRGNGEEITYRAFIATARPASHFTPRVVPFHPAALVPAEAWQIHWPR